METNHVSARKVVAELCAEVRSEEDPMARIVLPDLPPSDHIQHREELAYLNRHWCWEFGYEPQRTEGVAGLLLGRLKARLSRFVWNLLERRLGAERDFIHNLVRFNNELAKRCDQLSEEIRAMARAERQIAAGLVRRADLGHHLLEGRLAQLESMLQSPSEP